MNNFIGALEEINDLLQEKSFTGNEINIRAKKDFKFLCSKVRLSSFDNVDYQSVETMTSQGIGDFLVVGHDMTKKAVFFPKELVDVKNPEIYVAVVCYKQGEVSDVYVFRSANFASTGLFSMFKYNKKNDCYGVNMSNEKALKQYSFGYVIEGIQKQYNKN